MTESFLDYEKRPVLYNAVDGIDEMMIGFLFTSMPFFMHIANVAVEGSIWHWKNTPVVANVLVLILLFLARKLLKQRVTFRRTGYVKFRYSKVRGAIGAVIGFIVAGLVTYAIYLWSPGQRDRNLILLNGLLWAGFYSYFYIYGTKMYYFWKYLVAVVMAVGPIAIYSAFSEVRDISTLSNIVLGACFLISGIATFWLYLRSTQAANFQSPSVTE